MTIKVMVGSEILNVVSVYAPQIGLSEVIKKQFREESDMVIQDVPRSEKLFIGGNFNGHIGAVADEYETAHGGFGFGERNNGGVSILEFAVAYDLLVVNFLFKKKEDHLVTFKSGSFKTPIDFFLTRADSRRSCRDCKVIPSECVGSQHRLLVLDVEFNCVKWKMRGVGDLRVKWGNLSKDNVVNLSARITEKGAWRRVEDSDLMWKRRQTVFESPLRKS